MLSAIGVGNASHIIQQYGFQQAKPLYLCELKQPEEVKQLAPSADDREPPQRRHCLRLQSQHDASKHVGHRTPTP